jgi:hypothetical protein
MGISGVGKTFGARNAIYLVQFDPPVQVVRAVVKKTAQVVRYVPDFAAGLNI